MKHKVEMCACGGRCGGTCRLEHHSRVIKDKDGNTVRRYCSALYENYIDDGVMVKEEAVKEPPKSKPVKIIKRTTSNGSLYKKKGEDVKKNQKGGTEAPSKKDGTSAVRGRHQRENAIRPYKSN